MNKKKIIIISSAVLVLLIVLFFSWFLWSKNKTIVNPQNINSPVKTLTPEFLTTEEKNQLKIPADLKIQAVTRNQSGVLMVYKVIKNDQDIVNPVQVEPLNSLTK